MSFYVTLCPDSWEQFSLFNLCVKDSKTNIPTLYSIQNQQALQWAGNVPRKYIVSIANNSKKNPPGEWYYVCYRNPKWKTPMYLTFNTRSYSFTATTSSEATTKDAVLFQSKDYADKICESFKRGWEVKKM